MGASSFELPEELHYSAVVQNKSLPVSPSIFIFCGNEKIEVFVKYIQATLELTTSSENVQAATADRCQKKSTRDVHGI